MSGPKPPTMGPKDPEAPPRPNAAPPPCPRCELVKSQCTKTVINYQKTHRKKLEALRTELKSSRQRVERLQRQVQFYKATSSVVPALAVVFAASWMLLRRLRGRGDSKSIVQLPPDQPAAATTTVAGVEGTTA